MSTVQPGILAVVPRLARYLVFSLTPLSELRVALMRLCEHADGENTVIGIGQSTVLALGRTLEGLRVFPCYSGAGIDVPSTPGALWCWLRGDDRGELCIGRGSLHTLSLPPSDWRR